MFTCDSCVSPCLTCGDNGTDCMTCIDGYLWYDVDHTCYEEIIWNFPFASACGVLIILVWMVDCCFNETNILHSLVYFLSLLEDVVIVYLLYKWYLDEVPGDRTVAFVSFISHASLNFLYMFVHTLCIASDPTP
jgi:hypothetical protein